MPEPTTRLQRELAEPFSAFMLSTFHEPIVRELIDDEEADFTRLLGHVQCPGDHELDLLPCRSCGADV